MKVYLGYSPGEAREGTEGSEMKQPVRVIPAILTDDPKVLETMVRQAESFATYVQFDIMDGRFVPSQSITHEHLLYLPMKLKWEAHLMIECPEESLEGFQQAGAEKVVFHYEATSSPRKVISQARGLHMKVGLAANPETTVATIRPLVGEVDSVLFLTVHPGFYGSQFIPQALKKISALRKTHPEAEIGVDGGINESNIAKAIKAGADVIYVGGAIFLRPQPGESYRRLLTLAQRLSEVKASQKSSLHSA